MTFFRVFMTAEKKEIEKEVIVTNVSSKGDSVILDLRFTKPKFEEPTEQQLEKVMEPLAKTPMEQVMRDAAKAYGQEIQKQTQANAQMLQTLLPPTPPSDIIRIFLSKQEYVELGRPTVFDKLTLTLST